MNCHCSDLASTIYFANYSELLHCVHQLVTHFVLSLSVELN